MARIIVIEDQLPRIEWLRSVLRRSNAEIVWCQDVDTFIEESKKDHDLAIFDHDLEIIPSMGYCDPQPPTGADAAHLYHPMRVVPALVWSANDWGAQRIRKVLEEKKIPVTVCPYQNDQLEKLATALRRMFE